MLVDTPILKNVKRVVLYMRDMYEDHVEPSKEPPSNKAKFDGNSNWAHVFSMKHLFGYMIEHMERVTKMDELD